MAKIGADIPKKHSQMIRISENEFHGIRYVDIRQYYLDDDGEWKPTRRGVTFPPDLIGEAINGLRKLSENPSQEETAEE